LFRLLLFLHELCELARQHALDRDSLNFFPDSSSRKLNHLRVSALVDIGANEKRQSRDWRFSSVVKIYWDIR
jgi:hypothetical protein